MMIIISEDFQFSGPQKLYKKARFVHMIVRSMHVGGRRPSLA